MTNSSPPIHWRVRAAFSGIIGGQQIISRQITEQNTVVDLSGLNAGVYFVRVVDDEGVSVGKVVKR